GWQEAGSPRLRLLQLPRRQSGSKRLILETRRVNPGWLVDADVSLIRLAQPGYTCSEIVMHSETRRTNANTLKLLKVDSSPAEQRKFIMKAEVVGAGHV